MPEGLSSDTEPRFIEVLRGPHSESNRAFSYQLPDNALSGDTCTCPDSTLHPHRRNRGLSLINIHVRLFYSQGFIHIRPPLRTSFVSFFDITFFILSPWKVKLLPGSHLFTRLSLFPLLGTNAALPSSSSVSNLGSTFSSQNKVFLWKLK